MIETKEEAINRVDRAANRKFKAEAALAIEALAKQLPKFTADQVWQALKNSEVPFPKEPRILGAMMLKASRSGIIKATNKHIMSTKASNHQRPVRVWKSLIK